MINITEDIGKRFGNLVIVDAYRKKIPGHTYIYYTCECDCGVRRDIYRSSIINMGTRSCGCLIKETTIQRSITHGQRWTPTYSSWENMKTRCNNPNRKSIQTLWRTRNNYL